MQMEQEEAERARVTRMRRTAREAVVRRAQELSPTRKLSHSLSVPPTSTTQTPPIAGNPRRQQRSSSTSRITHKGSLDLPPCERAGTKSDESTAPQSPPKGYHKYTERLQAYIRSQTLKQPLELISSGAVTKEDRKQRYVVATSVIMLSVALVQHLHGTLQAAWTGLAWSFPACGQIPPE